MSRDDVVEVTRWSAVDAESSVCGTGSATANEPEGSGSAGCGGVRPEGTDPGAVPKLSVAAVARRLGVAPATLRTWDRRYGLGPTEHSSGSHRRYGPDDVARLELMQHALLRGASPAEAARYAHAASARQGEGRTEAGGETAQRGSRRDPVPEGLAENTDGAVLMSGVLESDGEPSEEPVDTANTGGRGLRLPGATPLARGLGRAVLALDSPAAQHILLESVTRQGVGAMRREVLSPVTRALAELRERTGSGAEMPKLLEDSALTVLRSVIAGAAPPRNPRPVLLATAPGEQQSLELIALAAALAREGVGHRLFASALPREGLEAAIRRAAPAAVLVWSEHSVFADPQVLTGLPRPRQRVRVFAAGPGWSTDALPEYVDHLDSWEGALTCLEGFAPADSS
ncbi:DNA-binding transcriptional MerR regulator [Actinopolyspora biskrensis]|uniref:DNA-binding transcriptional MerR regulator n=1 Tax=Actinopolyspora biskrensis TaxID=1470178 RepID=A0A852YWT8_9ACTN|nr:MerR family transcriptional regulator [Actinopolyspora biskrensis]NYH78490.1 DNA-binding transcriptional MerR regulator [Actinopolyspora biskrensis]